LDLSWILAEVRQISTFLAHFAKARKSLTSQRQAGLLVAVAAWGLSGLEAHDAAERS